MKKLILWMLTAALCLTACAPAFAAAGDRTLAHLSSADGYMASYIANMFVTEEGVAAYLNGQDEKIVIYREGGEPAEYLLEKEAYSPVEAMAAAEDEQPVFSDLQTMGWFSWNGGLYAVQYSNTYNGETSRIEGGFVKKAKLADGKVILEDCDIPQLEFDGMIEEYGQGYQSVRYLNKLMTAGSLLVGTTYDENGQPLLVTFDLTTGAAEEIPLQDTESIVPGPEGTLLMSRYEWTDQLLVHFLRYDIAGQSEEELGTIALGDGTIQGLCTDEKTGTLYIAMNGEIRAVRNMDFENAETVSDCPIAWDVTMQMLEDGRILLWNQNAAVIRNPDPAAKGDTFTLRIQDMAYADALQETIYDFTDARGDAAVVMKRGGIASGILQAMMNRDAETDIYTLNYDSSEFDALRNRGFLADLSGNESLSAAADRMYPFVQDAVRQDGKLIASPVALNGETLGFRKDLWEKIGGTEEELPKTWGQFFDWLETLPARVEGTDYAVFDMWMDRESFRRSVLDILLTQYQARLNQGGMEYAFNTPLLRGLLDRMDALDYDALKLAEPVTGDQEGGVIDYGDGSYKEPLLSTYADLTLQGGWGDAQPLVLSLEEGEEPILPVRLIVAFVNPYSAHAEAAAEYLALAMKNIRTNTRYALFADQKEPVRDPYYEENQKNLRQWLEEAKAQLEKDEENRTLWEENIRMYEENIADNEKNSWMLSPDAIASYEERAPRLKVLTYDFASALTSSENGGGDYYSMVWGYAQQQVSAQELLSGIDKKVQMMRLEGN